MRLAVADEQNKHFTTLRGKYSELEIILLMRYINLRLLTYLLTYLNEICVPKRMLKMTRRH